MQTRQYGVTKDANPQTCFTGMKKPSKVRLAFGHSKTPMEVRKTFKNDLHVPVMVTLQSIRCIQVTEKLQLSVPKKLNFFFPPCKVRSLLLSKSSVREERSKKEQILLKQKGNCSKFQSLLEKKEGKKRNISLVLTRK